MEFLMFFENAKIFLENEVKKIARRRGYIGKNEMIFTDTEIIVSGKLHHFTFLPSNNKKALVVITNTDDFCEVNDLVLFPAKQKYAKLAKTIAETVVSRLFEE
jgi:hypothetical protein